MPKTMTAEPSWNPRLRGPMYCSPACGAGCTKKAYDTATSSAHTLAGKMGPGWRPNVWENLGWHYSVRKGDVELCNYDGTYTAYFNAARQFLGTDKDPKRAVKKALEAATRHVNAVNLSIAEVTS